MSDARFDGNRLDGMVTIDWNRDTSHVAISSLTTDEDLRNAGFGVLEEHATFVTLTVQLGDSEVVWFGKKQ